MRALFFSSLELAERKRKRRTNPKAQIPRPYSANERPSFSFFQNKSRNLICKYILSNRLRCMFWVHDNYESI